jgi:hypothetical protein
MNSTSGSLDEEALRAEIQAAIAAGRDLSPDMDQHLADSVIERYRKERQTQRTALAKQHAAPPATLRFDSEEMGRFFLPLVGLAAFVAIVVLRPELWWVIFFLPMLGGWWGWGHWSHRTPHASRSPRRTPIGDAGDTSLPGCG